MRAKSAALIIALAVMPLLAGSDLRSGESRHPAQYACPPDHGADPEYPSDCGASGLEVTVIALGFGLLGYLIARGTAPIPASPDPVKVERAVKGVFTDRVGEANKHSVTAAVPLLDQAQDDVLAALKKEGVL
jgi:hypothetical protein